MVVRDAIYSDTKHYHLGKEARKQKNSQKQLISNHRLLVYFHTVVLCLYIAESCTCEGGHHSTDMLCDIIHVSSNYL
jgi:hypothetical protein